MTGLPSARRLPATRKYSCKFFRSFKVRRAILQGLNPFHLTLWTGRSRGKSWARCRAQTGIRACLETFREALAAIPSSISLGITSQPETLNAARTKTARSLFLFGFLEISVRCWQAGCTLLASWCTLLPSTTKTGAPDRIRTCDLWNRNPTLYPAELRVHPFGGRAAEAGCERFLA